MFRVVEFLFISLVIIFWGGNLYPAVVYRKYDHDFGKLSVTACPEQKSDAYAIERFITYLLPKSWGCSGLERPFSVFDGTAVLRCRWYVSTFNGR